LHQGVKYAASSLLNAVDEALLTDTLVSGQFYLRPPSQTPV